MSEREDDLNQVIDAGLEAGLRSALRPEEPPAGFAERVVRRVAATPTGTQSVTSIDAKRRSPQSAWSSMPSRVRWSMAKAAVLLLAITLPLGWRLYRQAELARGEAAKQQVLLALHITGSQLRSIQDRTQSMHAGGMPEGESR